MLHNRLKLLLSELGISQRQFALTLNLDPGYVSRIMQGKVVPPERILLLIESVFHVNPLWLRQGEGKMFTKSGYSKEKKQLLDLIETLDDTQIDAVLAFLRYLAKQT